MLWNWCIWGKWGVPLGFPAWISLVMRPMAAFWPSGMKGGDDLPPNPIIRPPAGDVAPKGTSWLCNDASCEHNPSLSGCPAHRHMEANMFFPLCSHPLGFLGPLPNLWSFLRVPQGCLLLSWLLCALCHSPWSSDMLNPRVITEELHSGTPATRVKRSYLWFRASATTELNNESMSCQQPPSEGATGGEDPKGQKEQKCSCDSSNWRWKE